MRQDRDEKEEDEHEDDNGNRVHETLKRWHRVRALGNSRTGLTSLTYPTHWCGATRGRWGTE